MKNITACALLISLAVVPHFLTAQDASSSADPAEKPADAKTDTVRRGPLPRMFGQLGVNDEQREKLYDIQGDYKKKIEPLQQQIKALLKERDQAMEAQLTPGQKLRLKELREEAARRVQRRAAAARDE